MDSKLKALKDIKEAIKYEGSVTELKNDDRLLDYCFKNFVIVKLKPGDLSREQREKYIDFLVEMTKDHITSRPEVTTWDDFKKLPDTKKVHGMLHEFGVKGEVFPYEKNKVDTQSPERSKTSLTLDEFYELCQVQFNYNGSLGSFKKFIAKQYGSFAEYCIIKGYDVNNTKWENDETALRVARKLGSRDAIAKRSKSLLKYLEDKELLSEVFLSKTE